MVNTDFMERFLKLREDLFAAIKKEIEECGYHKSYEGRLTIAWPHMFEDEYTISLDCYVIGPRRHPYWCGSSLEEALDKAENDIRSWIGEN